MGMAIEFRAECNVCHCEIGIHEEVFCLDCYGKWKDKDNRIAELEAENAELRKRIAELEYIESILNDEDVRTLREAAECEPPTRCLRSFIGGE